MLTPKIDSTAAQWTFTARRTSRGNWRRDSVTASAGSEASRYPTSKTLFNDKSARIKARSANRAVSDDVQRHVGNRKPGSFRLCADSSDRGFSGQCVTGEPRKQVRMDFDGAMTVVAK